MVKHIQAALTEPSGLKKKKDKMKLEVKHGRREKQEELEGKGWG